MPRDFGGIVEEHEAVRNQAGLFDLSHMGRIRLQGESVLRQFESVFTRYLHDRTPGRAVYGFLCNKDGGCVDDIIVYVKGTEEVWLVVNAGNRSDVVEFVQRTCPNLDLDDRTEQSVLIAIQGPDAPSWFSQLSVSPLPNSPFRVQWNGEMVATTGYTGENGGEIWTDVENGRRRFREALTKGLTPCGLGARDTLRLEMGYPLHGHELSLEIDPVTANLGRFIDWDHEFIGRESLRKRKREGPKNSVIGIRLESRRSPREGQSVRVAGDGVVGTVTSGRYSPTLGVGIGMALIDRKAESNKRLEVEVRGSWYEATTVKPPFI